jgi:integrase
MQHPDNRAPKSRRENTVHPGTADQVSGGGREEVSGEKRLARNRSGKWEIRWTDRDGEGKSRTRSASTHTDDYEIAKTVLRQTLKDERQDRLAAGGVVVGVLLDGYQKAAQARGVGATQLGCVRQLKGFWDTYPVEDICPEAVLEYRDSRGVAEGTLRRELNVLVAALNWGARHGKIKSAPPVDLPAEGAPRAVFLDEALEGELWALATASAYKMTGRLTRVGRFIAIALDTGARKSAIEGLTWDRVDLVRGVIDFRDPAMRATKKRRVATPIPARLLPVLQRAYAERGQSKFVLDHDGSIRKSFESFMTTHQFEDVTPHILKHTRITLLLRAGVSIWDVSALTGTSPKTIQDVYGHHATDSRLRDAANKRASAA